MEGCILEKNLLVRIQINCYRGVIRKNFTDAVTAGKDDTVAAIEHSVESSSSALGEKIKNRKASPEKKPPKQAATIKSERATLTSRSVQLNMPVLQQKQVSPKSPDKATFTSRSVQINMPVSHSEQVSPKGSVLQPEITEIDVWASKSFVYRTIVFVFFFRNKCYLVLCMLLKLNIQKSKLIATSPAVHFVSIQLFVAH